MRSYLATALGLIGLVSLAAAAGTAGDVGEQALKVGVPTILSGDFSALGLNIQHAVETYRRHFMRHRMEFVFEDAKKGSVDGLSAYQRLINGSHVQVLIGGTTSNGTLAGARLVNSMKVPLLTPLTGGRKIDQAGAFIFRIGNSDTLNGIQQAELLVSRGHMQTALLTEATDYTTDIAESFRKRYAALGGQLVFDEEFNPEQTDFKTLILRICRTKPRALFVSTQTGLAFGLFMRQFRQLHGGADIEIHTNFVAATNPEAYRAAGGSLNGVHYLSPAYDATNPQLTRFFEMYRTDHGTDPQIAFHAAGTFDALSLVDQFLDGHPRWDPEEFSRFLLERVRDYHGLMGVYSLDKEGNSTLGFSPQQIAER